jgi:hypothetical protein
MGESQFRQVEATLEECREALLSSLTFPGIDGPAQFVLNVSKAHECLQRRLVGLADGVLNCARAEHAVSAVVLARSCIETTAAIHYLARLAEQASECGDPAAIDTKLRRISFGGKDAKVGDVDAVNVLTMINHVAKGLGDVFRKVYDESSEYAHPNWLGTMGAYCRVDGDTSTFGSQSIPETLQLAEAGLSASLQLALIKRRYLSTMLPIIEATLRAKEAASG